MRASVNDNKSFFHDRMEKSLKTWIGVLFFTSTALMVQFIKLTTKPWLTPNTGLAIIEVESIVVQKEVLR